MRLTAKELRDDLESCMSQVGIESKKGSRVIKSLAPTRKDMKELREIVAEFLQDVDDKYGTGKGQDGTETN